MIFFFFFFIFLIFLNFYDQFFKTYKISSNSIVIINPGLNINKISNLLVEKEIIKNRYIFKLWIKINFLEKKIKYGEYDFSGKTSIDLVTKKLIKADTINRFITIKEGISKYDFISLLESKGKIVGKIKIPDFIIADTYAYKFHDSTEKILKDIKRRSYEIIKKEYNQYKKNIDYKTLRSDYILASIIEKETGKKSEMNKIAGVFLNRLQIKMRLQSDPTVIFGITQGKKFDRKLTRKDLKFESKYNTYRNNGLPPTAISIPSIDSIRAVLNPYKGNYFYFVANKEGGHFFSENYEEHLDKIRSLKMNQNKNNE